MSPQAPTQEHLCARRETRLFPIAFKLGAEESVPDKGWAFSSCLLF